MLKNNKKQLILSSIVILLPIFAGLLLWNQLPERITTPWGANGEADGWSGKAFSVFAIPVILLVAHWIGVFITVFDKKNKDQSNKVFRMVLWIMPVISVLTSGTVYAIALGHTFHISSMMNLIFGLLFLVMGNYMPKCKQNNTIGIKVTWTLRNEENWNKTHRFAGKLWVAGGVFVLATMLIPLESFMYGYMALLLIMAFAPMIYSYVYYRKQLQLGTATKEDGVATTYEKNSTKVAVGIGITALIFVAFFLFDGEFKVTFEEEVMKL